jgi:hypothetical protein
MIHYGPAYAQLSTCTFVYDEDDLIEWGPKSEAGPRSHESLLSVAKRAENEEKCKSLQKSFPLKNSFILAMKRRVRLQYPSDRLTI